jgi:ATP-binding cassette, subfamily C (CFTR/MRP), member 1
MHSNETQMDLGLNFRIIILSWADLETPLSAVTRIPRFAATPTEGQDIAQADVPESWPIHGSLAFRKFSASYTEGGKPVLKGADLSIKAGEKIGLCGRTGSRKSSLLATLFGVLHQQEGESLINDIRTTDVSFLILRPKIIALPQESFFLRGTVRHNFVPWNVEQGPRPSSDDQMKGALQ